MGLLQRDPVAPVEVEDVSVPAGAGRGRRLLVLGIAVAGVVAFTTLARPQGSPSTRLVIGESEGASPAEEVEAQRPPAIGAQPEVLLRSLDPATLADVPANVLALGEGAWPFPSRDGALLAVPDFLGYQIGRIDVVDARTFQPVATVNLESEPITGMVGFTPEADALIVLRGRFAFGQQRLTRYPLDPAEAPTEVQLPEEVTVEPYRAAPLPGGRVALLGVQRGGGDGQLSTWTPHVLVADLLAERVTVDLPLPDVRAELSGEVVRDGPLYEPGSAWDPASERLYVAHADRNRVTVVDLAAGAIVAEADIDSRVPAMDPDAPARNRRRGALLSPDGSRLYLTGLDFLPDGSGPALGLSVVDTATLTEVGYLNRVSDQVQLSPDGRWLAWTAQAVGEFALAGEEPFSRVGVLDTETLEQVALLGNGYRSSRSLGFSRDSTHFYLTSDDDEGRSVVRAHALPSLEQTGERRLSDGGWFEPGGAYLRESG